MMMKMRIVIIQVYKIMKISQMNSSNVRIFILNKVFQTLLIKIVMIAVVADVVCVMVSLL